MLSRILPTISRGFILETIFNQEEGEGGGSHDFQELQYFQKFLQEALFCLWGRVWGEDLQDFRDFPTGDNYLSSRVGWWLKHFMTFRLFRIRDKI